MGRELTHQGQAIVERLRKRRAVRRSRRQRHTPYRQARYDNRRRKDGWLPPSLRSQVQNVLTWVQRLRRLCPIAALSLELVRFDTQAMQDPDIAGVVYQQGTLAGFEVKEYVLEKWGRRCAYCDASGVPLEIEHIVPQSRGGSSRESNLTLSCVPCNTQKGTKDIGVFLAHDPERLARILAQAKTPLRDAAAVNTTRWALYERLLALGLPVEVGSGGRTKYNRPPTSHPQDPLDGCGLCGSQHTRGPAELADHPALTDYGHGQAKPAAVPCGETRLSAWHTQGTEPVTWLSDGRHGAGGGHQRRAEGHLSGTGRHQVGWLLQIDHQLGCG